MNYEYRCLICDYAWESDSLGEDCLICGEHNDIFIAEPEDITREDNMETETTKTNMLVDLDNLFSGMSDEEFLETYNQITGYDYDFEDIDWEQ